MIVFGFASRRSRPGAAVAVAVAVVCHAWFWLTLVELFWGGQDRYRIRRQHPLRSGGRAVPCGHCWRWAVILIWRSSPRVSSCRNRRRCCARSGASSSRASFTRTRHRPPDLMTYSVHPWARGGRKVVPGTAARRRIAAVLVRCGGCVAGWPLHRVGGDVRVRSGVAPGAGKWSLCVCWSGWSCGIGWSPDAGLTGSCRPVNW